MYAQIKDSKVTYTFESILPVKQICIQPTRNESKKAYLQSINISVNGKEILKLEDEALISALSSQSQDANLML